MTGATEFIGMLPDIPRFYTALAEWLACLILVLVLNRKWKGWKFVPVSVGFLAVQTIFMEVTDGFEGILWNFVMVAAFALMFLYLSLCTGAPPVDALYCTTAAFMVAEFAASAEWQLYCFLRNALDWTGVPAAVAVLILIYGLIFAVFFRVCRSAFTGEPEPLGVTVREAIVALMIVLAAFALSNLSFVFPTAPFTGRDSIEIFNIRTMADLGGAAILYAFHMQRKDNQTRQELRNVQNMLNAQYMQYQQSQQAIDIINYKYHDLKHHILALRSETDGKKRGEYLDRMEEEIKNYEAQFKTGNKVLDTLLGSKSIYCIQHHIDFTAVVDGSLFGFMDVMDICSIFGNALDNAIEYEKKLKDEEKRMIHLSAFSRKNFLIIRFENYYEGNLDLKAGLPETTKEDRDMHGYGLKSLKYTVHKYKGEVDISTQEGWFSLKILIPI